MAVIRGWPSSDDEWAEAIGAAVFSLALDSCYQYGLMVGPGVDVERCEELLDQARRDGRRIPTVEEVCG